MKIKDVDFPPALLNALRDGRLVVFAGAGVSMGPPANLPSFRKLAEQVAQGTGQSIAASETDDDQFLGRLREDSVRVHQRTAGILQSGNPKPNGLHRNLLRLFQRTGDPVRIVTTNFDGLFEQAADAEELFRKNPKVFEAPTLPLGSRFEGIVRLHGSVKEPEEMVLTHRDFGRAYLTEEDGWARRFLVSLFAKHTVLFVGYSHSDTIMTYLTPSLRLDSGEKRFALVGSESNDLDRWRRMGIEPVLFPQENQSDFTCLNTGVEGLAAFRRRGVIGWQQEIARIAEGRPPMIDNEDSHTIDHALTSVELTRFFVNAAQSPEWIAWLDDRGHLKRLFSEENLEEQDNILSRWLASQFVRNHSDKLFSVIFRYHGKLNRCLWKQFIFQLKYVEDDPLDSYKLSQWVHVLMNCIPMTSDEESRSIPISDYEYSLWNLAEHCIKVEALQSFLQVYDAITARLVWFLPGSKSGDDIWDWHMKKLWKESLKPNLPKIAHTLLERATMRLEGRHSASVAWSSQNDRTMDDDSYSRSAIEPHEQNRYSRRISSLIDTVRDCLEWLTDKDPVTVRNWCNRFINSDPPLLRRLAIHATNARQNISADDKIAWLLNYYDVNRDAAHHEIFRMAADSYPEASSQQKEALIQAVSQYQAPAETPKDHAILLAHHKFNWFQWLHEADPTCGLAKNEFDNIQAQNPNFTPDEHPDFTNYFSGFTRVRSFWTAEMLLEKPAHEWLTDLLTYQLDEQEGFPEHSCGEMLPTVNEVVQSHPAWGLDLADAMAARSEWTSDLWEWVISAWGVRGRADLDQDSMSRVLYHLSTSELHQPRNARVIAVILNRLIQKIDAADLTKRIDRLHEIAIAIYPHSVTSKDKSIENSQDRDWLEEAINHPSGKLAEFWIRSIDFWHKQQAVPPQALSTEYRHALDTIIEDQGISGKLGRTILTSQLDFLHQVDNTWTEQHLLPLFDANDKDFSCAWGGYLAWGRLSLPIAELLKDKFISGLQRAIQDLLDKRLERFIRFYIFVKIYLTNDAKDEWICKFFNHAQKKPELRHIFTIQVGRLLRDLDESSQNEWWNVWLKDYWSNRLQGVPCPLDNGEIATMFEWVIHLQGVFPEAVSMAVKMDPVSLEGYSRLLDQVDQSNLIDRHPNDLAKLLIHLGQSHHPPWHREQNLNILHQLREKKLPDELAQELDNLILKIKISSS